VGVEGLEPPTLSL